MDVMPMSSADTSRRKCDNYWIISSQIFKMFAQLKKHIDEELSLWKGNT